MGPLDAVEPRRLREYLVQLEATFAASRPIMANDPEHADKLVGSR